MKQVFKALLFGSVVLHSYLADGASLRCKNVTVSSGDSKIEVSRKCGEPVSKEQRPTFVEDQTPNGSRRVSKKLIEEWTYNFGPNAFIQTVVFEDGIVIDVQQHGYGW